MAFWGVEVKPGKVCPFVPPPEGSKLHLSQASLGVAASKGVRCALHVKVGDGKPLVLCCLREGGTESTGLDLIFDSYAEFSVEGPAAVHLTGYYMPEYELDDAHDYEDDSDDDDNHQDQILGYDEYGVPVLASEYDSEDDSDYESEEGGSGDEDEEGSEEDSESDDDDDGIRQLGQGRRVVIEEINDDEPAGAAKPGALKALPAPETANGKAAHFGDDDVSASDEDEEDDGKDDDEESSEEEEEEVQVPQQAQQHAGQKRKSEAASTPAKKQAVEDAKSGKLGQPSVAAAAQTPKPQQGSQQVKEQQKQKEKSAAKQQQKEAGQQLQAQQQPKSGVKQQQQAKTPAKEEPVAAGEVPSSNKKVRRFANGFEIEELKQGRPDSKLAKPGKKVVVKYVGKLKSTGKIFDQTQGNRTFTFRLGVGEVIKGWDKGVENMRVGDKRRLTIPPQMAYGTQGVRGAIPPNAWLNFDVELVDVKG